jgi:hypothetical protein
LSSRSSERQAVSGDFPSFASFPPAESRKYSVADAMLPPIPLKSLRPSNSKPAQPATNANAIAARRRQPPPTFAFFANFRSFFFIAALPPFFLFRFFDIFPPF